MLRHFTYYMQDLSMDEKYEVLCPLFDNDTWMKASFENSNSTYNDFLTDLERAWDAAEKKTESQIEINQEPIIQCIRYLLIRTSINSLAENYPPALISKVLDSGLWTSDRTIGMVANISDAEVRIDMYRALLSKPYLAQSKRNMVQSQSLKDARSLSESSKARALVALAPYLSGEQRQEVFQDAHGFSDAEERALILAALLPNSYLPGRQRFVAREEALQAVLSISDLQKRTEVLATLAPFLLEQQRFAALEDTLQAVITDYKENNFSLIFYPLLVEALINLAPYLNCQLRQYALDEALSFPNSQAQAILTQEQELVALGPLGHLAADEHRKNTSSGVLAFQSQIITVLAPYLSDEQLQRAFQAAFALPDGQERAQALTAFIPLPRLPEEQRLKACEEALRVTLALPDGHERIQALSALIPYLPPEQRFMRCEEVLSMIPDLPYAQEITKLLATLVPYLNDEQVLQLAPSLSDEVLTALIPRLSTEQAQLLMQLAPSLSKEVLNSLIPRLTDEQFQLLMQGSRCFSDEPAQAEAAIVFVPYLNDEQRQHVLEIALRELPVQKQVALAPYLSDEQLQHVVKDARSLPDHLQLVHALAALVPYLPEPLSHTTLTFALETALTIKIPIGGQAEALAVLAPFLNDEQILRAWEAALAISDTFFSFYRMKRRTQAYALAALAVYFPEQQRLSALEHALQTVLVFRSKHPDIDASTMNASLLLPLVILTPHLSGQLRITALNRALEVVLAGPMEQDRAGALANLAPYLSTEQFQHALQDTLALSDKKERILNLAALAPYLTDDIRPSILTHALEDALSIDKTDKAQAKALGILAPYLTGELLQRAKKASFDILPDWDRVITLTKFLSVTPVPADLLQVIRQALVKAIRSQEQLSRRQILSELFIKDIFRPPIFSSEALCNIAFHVFDICEHWSWPK